MSLEVAIALAVAVVGLCGSCITVGIVIGKLQNKVDTLQKDMNNAFRMLRVKNFKGE